MFVAQMNSESYSWIALGETREQAGEAIRKKWNKRQRNIHKNDPDFEVTIYKTVEELDNYYGIAYFEMKLGQCEVW